MQETSRKFRKTNKFTRFFSRLVKRGDRGEGRRGAGAKKPRALDWRNVTTIAAAVSVLAAACFFAPGAPVDAAAPTQQQAPAPPEAGGMVAAPQETGLEEGRAEQSGAAQPEQPSDARAEAPEDAQAAAGQPTGLPEETQQAQGAAQAQAAQPAAEQSAQPQTEPSAAPQPQTGQPLEAANAQAQTDAQDGAAARPGEAPTEPEAANGPQASAGAEGETVPDEAAPAVFTEDLAEGSLGGMVPAVEERLAGLGYMGLDETPGSYDAQTAEAVGYFQRDNGVPQTGVVDQVTATLLMSELAKPYNIGLNAQGEDVRRIQAALAAMEYGSGVDGVFGESTAEAVKAFQAMNGLNVTGTVSGAQRDLILNGGARRANGMIQEQGLDLGIEAVIAVAEQQLGDRYILGAKGGDSFDCSGLVYYCLNQGGFPIGYMTSGDWAGAGYTTVKSMGDLQRGDIVCFSGHVGIYLGDGQMIDASSSEGRVRRCYDIQSDGYWTSNFICGKRVWA